MNGGVQPKFFDKAISDESYTVTYITPQPKILVDSGGNQVLKVVEKLASGGKVLPGTACVVLEWCRFNPWRRNMVVLAGPMPSKYDAIKTAKRLASIGNKLERKKRLANTTKERGKLCKGMIGSDKSAPVRIGMMVKRCSNYHDPKNKGWIYELVKEELSAGDYQYSIKPVFTGLAHGPKNKMPGTRGGFLGNEIEPVDMIELGLLYQRVGSIVNQASKLNIASGNETKEAKNPADE
jgi:hypothetical protein